MLEQDEEIKDIVDRILTIAPGNNLSVLIPTHFADPNLRLESLAKKILSEESRPTILLNVQPWNTFNVLHGIYCQKLKECQEIGFNVIVLLYDKLVEKKATVATVEKKDIQEAVKNNIKWFIRAGIKEKKTEFLIESDLWSFIKFEHFAETVTSLSHLCTFDKNWAERKDAVSYIMDNLCEIYYENVINCDILLAGDIDVQQIWSTLRSKILDRNILPTYNPPLILSFPILNGIDGRPLSTANDDNSLSIKHTGKELRTRIDECDEDFLKNVVQFLIIPQKKRIQIKEKAIYSFEELKKAATLEEIHNLVHEYINEYFYKIRGVKYE